MDQININSLFGDLLPPSASDLRAQGVLEANASQLPGGMAAMLAPMRGNNMRLAASGLFGVDTSTAKERLQTALGQLDLQSPSGQIEAVKLVNAVSPTDALQLQAVFDAQAQNRTASEVNLANAQTARGNMSLRGKELDAANAKVGTFDNAKQAEISSLREQFIRRGGMTPQDAQDMAVRVATGQIQVTANEDGTATMTDRIAALSGEPANTRLPFIPIGATSQVVGLPGMADQTAQSKEPSQVQSYADTIGTSGGPSLFEAAEQGTGFWNVTRDVVGRFFNNFYEGALDEEKTQAADTLKNAVMPLIRSLSLNPRFPVGEQDRIRESIKIDPKLFRSPTELKVHLVGVDNILEKEQKKLLERMSDTQTGPDQVSQDRVSFRDIQAFRDMIFPREVKIGSIDTPSQVQKMSRTRAREYINSATDQELESLSPEVMAEFLNILNR